VALFELPPVQAAPDSTRAAAPVALAHRMTPLFALFILVTFVLPLICSLPPRSKDPWVFV
jgi:hypothetical protein